MDHHICIGGPYVRSWFENDGEDHRGEDRHEEPDQNQGPARERQGRLGNFLLLPILRLYNLQLRLIVVLGRRGQVRLFVPLRLGGSPLVFRCILCPWPSPSLCKKVTGRTGGAGHVASPHPHTTVT